MKLKDKYTYNITAYVGLQDADLFSEIANGQGLGHFIGRDKETYTVFNGHSYDLSSYDVEDLLKNLVTNQIDARLSIEASEAEKNYHAEVYKIFGKYTSKISKGKLEGYRT